jgi:hypothetical protein
VVCVRKGSTKLVDAKSGEVIATKSQPGDHRRPAEAADRNNFLAGQRLVADFPSVIYATPARPVSAFPGELAVDNSPSLPPLSGRLGFFLAPESRTGA